MAGGMEKVNGSVTMWNNFSEATKFQKTSGKQPITSNNDPVLYDIEKACAFKGKVDARLRSAYVKGDIKERMQAMAANDVLMQWRPRTLDAKTRAVDLFKAHLRATDQYNYFFPRGQLECTTTEEEAVLCEFAQVRCVAGMSVDSVLGMVSHVRTWCNATLNRTFGNKGSLSNKSYTSQVLKGMRLYQPAELKQEQKRSALSWKEVLMMRRIAQGRDTTNEAVAVGVAFAGMFRMGELTSTNTNAFNPLTDLAEQDLYFFPNIWNATHVTIRIGASKADQNGVKDQKKPRVLPVAPNLPGGWLREMLARRHGVPWGYDFRLTARPLFCNGHGAHLTQDQVLRFIRTSLRRCGYTEERVKTFGTHSARIGGATRLHQLGMTSEVIKEMGGWSSDAWKTYIRMQRLELLDISRNMCK